MALVIDDLVDDCLLVIFELDTLDIFDLVSITQVCKRWSQLTKSKLDKVSNILLNDPDHCPEDHPFDQPKMKTTSIQKIQSILEYLGPQLTSVKLGDCHKNTIVFGQQVFNIVGDCDPDKIVSILSQTCTNISELQIGEQFIELKNLPLQLLKSNRNLKKVILPENNLLNFPKCTFESVNEVTWRLTDPKTVKKFMMPFPNMKKLTLKIVTPLHQIDTFVGSVLRHMKNIKSLTIIVYTGYESEYEFNMLSSISNLSQLEELVILNNGTQRKHIGFKMSSVKKLIKKCPNLRVLKFEQFGLGPIDVSIFLALRKLELLYVSTFSNFTIEAFSRIKQKNLKKLAAVNFQLSKDEQLNVSGLIDFVRKLPALKKLVFFDLPAETSFELSCEIITSQLALGKEILIRTEMKDYVKIYKVEEPKVEREQFIFWSHDQAKNYQDRILKFVESLGGCMVGKQKFGMEIWEGMGDENKYLYDGCSCIYGHYDSE